MDRKIIDSMFYGNINYFDEGSFEVHTIQKNSTYIPDSCGFNINIGTNIVSMNNYSIQKPIKKDNIKCLKSWYITKKKTLVSTELLKIRDSCGFNINIGTNIVPMNNYSIQKPIKKDNIKCLKSWYITKKKTLVSTELLKIRGNLYDHKNNTTSREIHDAGFIKKIIKKNLIKTTNGKYHIISPPAEPKTKLNEKFYTFWMITGGFPQKFNDL